jgi:DNA-binding MarR family transcriptional regulator
MSFSFSYSLCCLTRFATVNIFTRNICTRKYMFIYLHTQVYAYIVAFMNERLADHELDAWQAFLHTYHHVMTVLEVELSTEHKLTLAQYDVLLRLARAKEPSLRMTQIAERVLVSPSGVTRVIDGLASRGFVERERSTDDARVVLARLTEDGRKAIKRASKTHLRGIREHFSGRLTESQLREVTAGLQVICGPHQPH